jgi:hypothetical protein
VVATVGAPLGCNGKGSDSAAATLPPDSGGTSDSEDSGGTFDGNPGNDTGFNLEPEVALGISHIGHWDQTPVGGPYTAMTGELLVEEMVDGRPDQPWCRVMYALTGLALDAHTCDLCDSAFLVEFFVVAEGQTDEELAEYGPLEVGGQAECFSPDLPADGERWEMGWSSIDETLYFNYYGSNIWLPWYAGLGDHDRVEFSWITSAGFHMPEEDD